MESLLLLNASGSTNQDQYAPFSRSVLGDALPWVESEVDDVLDCLLLEEYGINLGAVVVTPLLHELLQLASMDFDLLYFQCCKVSPDSWEVACSDQVAKHHNHCILISCIGPHDLGPFRFTR